MSDKFDEFYAYQCEGCHKISIAPTGEYYCKNCGRLLAWAAELEDSVKDMLREADGARMAEARIQGYQSELLKRKMRKR